MRCGASHFLNNQNSFGDSKIKGRIDYEDEDDDEDEKNGPYGVSS